MNASRQTPPIARKAKDGMDPIALMIALSLEEGPLQHRVDTLLVWQVEKLALRLLMMFMLWSKQKTSMPRFRLLVVIYHRLTG